MGYFIKTKSGTKGPFSIQQLRSFLDAGKIPGSLNVLDGETRRWVPVSAVLSGAEDASEDIEEPASRRGLLRSSKRGAPVRRRSSAVAPAEGKPARRWLKVLAPFAGIVVLLAALCFFLWRQDTDFREAGRKHILASGLQGDDLRIALLVAEGCHGAVLNDATPEDIRGRKSFLSVRKEDYLRVLDQMVARRLEEMREKSPRSEADLLGYWEQATSTMRTVAHLKSGGTYAQVFFPPDDSGFRDPAQKTTGTWKLSGDTIEWAYKGKLDPNPFVRFGSLAFVIREMDGRLTYWRRLAEHESVTRHFR